MAGTTYIFLDYDGVVACARECSKKTLKKLAPGESFVPDAMAQLNRLVRTLEEAGRDVRAVPITNRLRWLKRSKIYESLEKAGFEGTIDTKHTFSRQIRKSRGEALVEWCEKHLGAEDEYVILDNNEIKKLPDTMAQRHIQPDRYAKLSEADVNKALDILGVAREKAEAQAIAKEESQGGSAHRDRQQGKERGARSR